LQICSFSRPEADAAPAVPSPVVTTSAIAPAVRATPRTKTFPVIGSFPVQIRRPGVTSPADAALNRR
jgi:hypothetical protein